tara:strand:+ start:1908 stop:2579 length:672 start_codon:yes stop_codon:yes gene_type:complete
MDEPEEVNEDNVEEETESVVSDNNEQEDLDEEEKEEKEETLDIEEEPDADADADEEDDEVEDDEEINKEDIDELNSSKSDIYKPAFIFNDDLETNDSNEFLQKFCKDSKKDFIAANHQECLSKNLDEIKDLINVIRDKNNIIIDELHKTLPMLTKYEKTRILGIRLKQLNNGALPYIKVDEDILDNFLIAEKELKQKKIPFIIQRPIPNNTFEYWKLQDLEIL